MSINVNDLPGMEGNVFLNPDSSRLTINLMIYFAAPGESPSSIPHGCGRWLTSKEQPYIRKLTVGPEWTKVDTGWVDKPGMLFVENAEGVFMQVFPTPEQVLEARSKVVEFGVMVADVVVPNKVIVNPVSGAMFEVDGDLYFRCRNGSAACRLVVYPR